MLTRITALNRFAVQSQNAQGAPHPNTATQLTSETQRFRR